MAYPENRCRRNRLLALRHECPVCNRHFSAEDIHQHADMCAEGPLQLQAFPALKRVKLTLRGWVVAAAVGASRGGVSEQLHLRYPFVDLCSPEWTGWIASPHCQRLTPTIPLCMPTQTPPPPIPEIQRQENFVLARRTTLSLTKSRKWCRHHLHSRRTLLTGNAASAP
jgi:hypothetical protein